MKSQILEGLEARRLFYYNIDTPHADIRVDANRDGKIDRFDNAYETQWKKGAGSRGALVLPNLDRDNTTTPAPDNWTGGNWNGTHIGPNNVIDNDADLADIGRLRLSRLGNMDSSIIYVVTLRLKTLTGESSWQSDVDAEDRVRLFMPTRKTKSGSLIPRAGDTAILGPGLGDTIRFVYAPAAPNEYPVSLLNGDGFLEFGVEGLRPGMKVGVDLTVRFEPVRTFFSTTELDDEEPPVDPEFVELHDSLTLRVAPFALTDHRQAISDAPASVFIDIFEENYHFRKTMREVFGDRLIEGKTGDIWQQDGCEIGFVQAPYGSMAVVLELPRSRGEAFTGGTGIRAMLRGKLLASGVGVCTDVAAYPHDSSSAYGGDIETLPVPGKPHAPPFMLRSIAMPTYLKQFFDVQDVNKPIEIDPDAWLGVGHVDEVAQIAADGKHLFVADAELGLALLLLARHYDADALMHAGMNGTEYLPGGTVDGIRIRDVLANGRLRRLNLEKVMKSTNLPAAQRTLRQTLGLTEEVSTPIRGSNNGTASLLRAGVFTQLLKGERREYAVRFRNADQYDLYWRKDASSAWSAPEAGRRSQDSIFPNAKAFLLANVWGSGTTVAGDRFTFKTVAEPTMLKMPVLYQNSYTFADFGGEPVPDGFEEDALNNPVVAFTTSPINSLVNGRTVITGKQYGPLVNYAGNGKADLFQDYVSNTFVAGGYKRVRFIDARFYHNGSGGVHCGTNVFRDIPSRAWWLS